MTGARSGRAGTPGTGSTESVRGSCEEIAFPLGVQAIPERIRERQDIEREPFAQHPGGLDALSIDALLVGTRTEGMSRGVEPDPVPRATSFVELLPHELGPVFSEKLFEWRHVTCLPYPVA